MKFPWQFRLSAALSLMLVLAARGGACGQGQESAGRIMPAVSAGNGLPSDDTAATAATTTIEGLVRDIACPIQNKEATATKFNLKCARQCARLGSPLVILAKDGTLYTPISRSMPDADQRKRLMPFLGRYVRVTGQVFERSGTRAIAVSKIEEVKGVHLITNAE